ncbi:MAG: beta strand repeat-containing protein [Phycisphaerales bacterium]
MTFAHNAMRPSVRSTSVGPRAIFAAAGAAMAIGASAHGQTATWNLNNPGPWDTTTSNWLISNAAATFPSTPGSIAVFGNVITAGRTLTIAPGGITTGQIDFNSPGLLFYTIGNAAGNSLTLNNNASDAVINVGRSVVGAQTYAGVGGDTISTSPLTFTNNLSINNNATFATTDLTIASPISHTGAGSAINVSGRGNTSLSGLINNTVGSISNSGPGTLNLSNTSNAFVGSMNVSGGGVLAIFGTSDAIMGNSSNGFNLSNGGTVRFASASPITVGSSRVFNLGTGGGGIDIASGATVTAAGTGQFTGGGPLALTLTAGTTAGTLSVEGANAGYTGAISIGGGAQQIGSAMTQRLFQTNSGGGATLRLQNAGTLANASSVTVGNNANLVITQPTTAVTGRLGSAPLTFNNGRFQYNTSANGGVAINDTFGNVTINGMATFSGSTAAGPAAGTTLNFGTLTRNDNATIAFRAPASGTGSIGGAASTGERYLFSGMADSGGSGTSRGVVPWASYINSTTGTDFLTLATYDSNGFRQLAATEWTPATTTLTAGVNNNVQGTINNPGVIAVQSILNTTGTPNFTGTGTITVTSGAFQVFNTTTVNGPSLNFPNGGYLHLGFPVNVQGTSAIAGTNGIVASAFGGTSSSTSYRLNLTGTTANTFTGGLFANGQAQVTFTANNQLGQDGGGLNAGAITLGGGQLLYIPTSATAASLSDSGNNRSIFVNAASGTIGTAFAGATMTIPGSISGSGQMQFGGGTSTSATGIVELTNSSANTYSGGTLISTGILRTSNTNQLGTGTVFLNGGTLQAGAPLTFASAPTVIATSTIDTNGNNINLNGGLNGNGGSLGAGATSLALTRNGAGTITVGGESTYAGSLSLTALSGTFEISGNGRMSSLGAVAANRSTIFNINDSATQLSDRTGANTNITLANGGVAGGATMNLTTNAAGSTFTLGSLTVSGGGAGQVNNSFLNLLDGGSGNNTVMFQSLASINTNNTLNIVGSTNLGTLTSGVGSHIFFATAPLLSGGVIPNVVFTGFGGTNVPATYDASLGVIAFIQTTGSFIDNINSVGPGSITPTNTNFVTNAATTANLGATISGLTIAGHVVTNMPGTYAPQAGNANAGTNNLVLTGGNLTTTTGPSSITSASASTVQFGSSGNVAANFTIGTGANLTIDPNVTLSTTGALNKTGAGNLIINGTNNITGIYNATAGTVFLPASGSTSAGLTGSASGTINLGGGTLSINGPAGSNSSATVLAGTGNLTLVAANASTQTLSGANTFAGAINVNGGTLVAGGATSLGNAANAVTVGNGGTLGFGGVAIAATNPVSITGVGAAGRNGAIDNITGTSSFAGPITLTGNATIGATAGSLTLSGGLLGAGVPTFNPAASTTITLSTVALNIGANDLNQVGAGTLVLPNLANTLANVNASGGGFVRASADNNLGATTNAINLTNLSSFQYGASFALNAVRPITVGAGGGGIDTNTFSAALSQGITGSGSFYKFGTGTLTMNGASSYLGDTNIRAGVIALGVSNALANTNLFIGDPAASNTTSQLALGGFNQTVSSLTFYGRGNGNVAPVVGVGTLTVNGSISYIDNTAAPGNAFPMTLGTAGSTILDLGGSVRAFNLSGQNNTVDLTIAAVIQNGGVNFTGTPSSFNASTAAMTLSAVNTYVGATTVNRGVLNAGVAGALPAATDVTMANAVAGQNATLNLATGAQTIASLATSGGAIGANNLVTMNANNLTISGAANTTFNGIISGSAQLLRSGAGSTNLTNANLYSGGTAISSGASLYVNNTTGSAVGTGNVTVAINSTLGGSGIINIGTNLISVAAGGNLSPGNSPGILTTTSNVTMAATSNLVIEINGTNVGTDYDQLVVNGAPNTINITGANLSATLGWVPNGIIDYFIVSNNTNNAIVGTFAGLPEGQIFFIGGNQATITYLADAGNNSFTGGNDIALRIVPTPGAGGLLMFAGLIASNRRRRAA